MEMPIACQRYLALKEIGQPILSRAFLLPLIPISLALGSEDFVERGIRGPLAPRMVY